MKLRRSVIMIIACNRLKKLSSKLESSSQGITAHLDQEDIHKCVTSITSQRNAMPLSPEMADTLFTQLCQSVGPSGLPSSRSNSSPSTRLLSQQPNLSIFNCRRFESVIHLLSIGLQNIKLVLPDHDKDTQKRNTSSTRSIKTTTLQTIESSTNLPQAIQRVFLQSRFHVLKQCARLVKSNMQKREEELSTLREQAGLTEDQLTDQAAKYLELQTAMQGTLGEFEMFKER